MLRALICALGSLAYAEASGEFGGVPGLVERDCNYVGLSANGRAEEGKCHK